MKRLLARILICIIAGAIINVAVAWALAYCVDVFAGAKQIGFRVEDGLLFNVSRWDGFGSTRVYSTFSWSDSADPSLNVGDPAVLIPKYVADVSSPIMDIRNGNGVEAKWGDGRGWPLKCMSSSASTTYSSNGIRRQIEYGIELTSRPWRRYPNGTTMERVLPLRPIWPGFLANQILYAGIVYMFVFAVIDLRQMRRRRRRQCLKCGHHLLPDQVACPECGWRRNVTCEVKSS